MRTIVYLTAVLSVFLVGCDGQKTPSVRDCGNGVYLLAGSPEANATNIAKFVGDHPELRVVTVTSCTAYQLYVVTEPRIPATTQTGRNGGR